MASHELCGEQARERCHQAPADFRTSPLLGRSLKLLCAQLLSLLTPPGSLSPPLPFSDAVVPTILQVPCVPLL